jgi:hypothetical protein
MWCQLSVFSDVSERTNAAGCHDIEKAPENIRFPCHGSSGAEHLCPSQISRNVLVLNYVLVPYSGTSLFSYDYDRERSCL